MTSSLPLITYTSSLSVTEIIDRIEKILNEKQVTIFSRISHSNAANDAGLTMQDEELIIFGNPKVGTSLMLEQPGIGIELPLKIIAWQDKQKTIVAYQDLDKLANTFSIKMNMNTITVLKEFMNKLIEVALR